MTLVRYLALIAVGFVMAGLVFEAGVRLFVPMSDVLWTADPVVGMKFIPNKRGRFVKAGLFDVMVETNSLGFRDREHADAKTPGTARIVLLGDSYLEALQVPRERSVAVLLEEQLRARGLPVEVINLGISGFGTAREYLMLREYGLRFQPDLVLLFFVGNDVVNNSRRLEGLPYLPYPVSGPNGTLRRDSQGQPAFTPIVDPPSRLGYFGTVLKDYSLSYRFLRTLVESAPGLHAVLYRYRLVTMPPAAATGTQAGPGPYAIYQVDVPEVWAEAWSLTESLLLETRNLAHKYGALFAVALVPAPWEIYPEKWARIVADRPGMRDLVWDLDKPSQRLTTFLSASAIPHAALLPSFRRRATDARTLYFEHDAHWTADGHALAAELIAPQIERLLRNR